MSNEFGYFYWAKIYYSSSSTQSEEIIDISSYNDTDIYAMGISRPQGVVPKVFIIKLNRDGGLLSSHTYKMYSLATDLLPLKYNYINESVSTLTLQVASKSISNPT